MSIDNSSSDSFMIETYNEIKNNIRVASSYYLNHFDDLFSNHYISIINNVNFFHYATESILIEIIKSNSMAIEKLKTLRINKICYYDNIKLITGSCYLQNSFSRYSEMAIAELFFFKFEEIIQNAQDGEDFTAIFMEVIHQAASATLFSLGVFTNIETPLALYDIYDKLDKPTVLINFIKAINKNVGYDVLHNDSVIILVKLYYFFAKTKYEHFLKDLELFNEHSSSLFDKIRKFSSVKAKVFTKNIQSMFDTSETYKNLREFYKIIYNTFNEKKELITKNNFKTFKLWVNNSLEACPKIFSLDTIKLFLFDRITMPSKNIVVFFNEKNVSLFLFNMKDNYLDKISGYLKDKAENLKEEINQMTQKKYSLSRYEVKQHFIDLCFDNSKKMKESVEIFCEELQHKIMEYFYLSRSYIGKKYYQFLCLDEE